MIEKRLYQDKNWLYQKYINEKLSIREIAKFCKVSSTCIWRWLIKYKIKRRNNSESKKGKYCGENHPFFGKHHSQKTKEIMSESHMGKIPWNKGRPHLKGENNPMYGVRFFGEKNHMWGKHLSEEAREKLSKSLTGMFVKEKHWNWKGGTSRAYKTGYGSIQYKEWRKKVFERDNYICQDCGICSGNGKATYLTAHHIKSFAKYPELKFKVSNGITLCELCHCEIDGYRARFMKQESQIG